MRISIEASILLHLTFVITFLILGSLSRIFGLAKKVKPYYRLHYIAAGLCIVPMVLARWQEIPLVSIITMISDLIALTLGAWTTYFYWKWLPKELRG